MNKKEIIWREILFQVLENKQTNFSQKEIAQKYGFSLSTIFNALKAPRNTESINVSGRGFKVVDIEKFLYLWATSRRLKKDIIYQTYSSKSVREIENEMPANILFSGCSAYIKKYKDAPADYDKVYIYSNDKNLNDLKKRFPFKKGNSNIIVLLADPWLKGFGKKIPDCQLFADLWNMPEWYAKDFLNALKDKILNF